MKERPILFSAPMVRARLDGSKTQTRRVVKPQPPTTEAVRKLAGIDYSWISPDRPGMEYHRPAGPVWAVRKLMGVEPEIRCPYGQPGDRLWVRETWWHDEEDNAIIYRADPGSSIVDVNKHETDLPKYNWRPSIFMPRCASRITLEITRIRIEHLQAINEVDAIAEGAPWAACGSPQDGSHKAGYAKLWESIHGPGSWDANPWVWVIEFKGLPA